MNKSINKGAIFKKSFAYEAVKGLKNGIIEAIF